MDNKSNQHLFKKTFAAFSLTLALLLTACSGSETYRGSWKAMNTEGAKFELSFDANTFTVKDSTGSEKFEYSQYSVNIKNSVATYGIRLDDGRGYEITFPKAADRNVGFINDENGNIMYAISRTDYISYEDIYKLK